MGSDGRIGEGFSFSIFPFHYNLVEVVLDAFTTWYPFVFVLIVLAGAYVDIYDVSFMCNGYSLCFTAETFSFLNCLHFAPSLL